jgi:hypothetical protein
MSELLITAVWVVTLCVVAYCGLAEIEKLFADEVPRRRRRHDGGTTYSFDVARLDREAMVRGRPRRRGTRP